MDNNVLQYLKDNLYLIREGESFVVSNKFYRDTRSRLPIPTDAHVVSDTIKSSISTPVGSSMGKGGLTKNDYKEFIEKAQVPSKINAGNGSFFWANRYSNDGFKAWKNAIESVEYKVLLAATTYYYKQGNTARVMVGNFFSQGIYESFVDDVNNALDKKKTLVVEDSSSNMEQG